MDVFSRAACVHTFWWVHCPNNALEKRMTLGQICLQVILRILGTNMAVNAKRIPILPEVNEYVLFAGSNWPAYMYLTFSVCRSKS